jgi:glycosyltransferase involved in cell wall biosynthesis
MKTPKISIVTPVFNQVNFIEQTILSVLSQNYPNLEYIIIDGGSTDGTLNIIKKYENKLTFWLSEPDKGMYDAVQKGFDRSTGEIMAWINSDDMYHPNAFFTVAEIFQTFPKVKWFTGMPTVYNERGIVVQLLGYMRWNKFAYYKYTKSFIQQESTFWRRELWDNAGGTVNTKHHFAGDFDLWIRFFKFEKLYFVPTLIGGFRQRTSNQLSLDNFDAYLDECDISRQKALLSLSIKDRFKIKITTIDKIIYSLPYIRGLYIKSKIPQKYFDYPKDIIFDRSQQKFVFKD